MDADDIDEVLDCSIHRLTQLHVEEELPRSVVPVQMPERLVRLLADQARRQQEAH